MDRKLGSIIEELDRFVPERSKHLMIESRAQNLIVGAINLLKLIDESFNEEDAADLKKRLVNSIKSEDPNKFKRKIRQLKEDSDRKNRNGKSS